MAVESALLLEQPSAPEEILTDLPSALEMHRRGEFEGAQIVYEKILYAFPDHPDVLQLFGVMELQRGNPHRAAELIERAIALIPACGALHGNLAEAYRQCGQPDRALECGLTALELQPGSADAANNLGSLFASQGRVDDAVANFELALRLRPDSADFHNNLGNAHRMRGEAEQALAQFRRAVELQPDSGYAHGNLGQLLLECRRPAEALFHCEVAAALMPDAAAVQNNLGNVYRKLGRLSEAKALYSAALRLAPELAMVQNNYGQVLQEEGRLDEATRWYLTALEREPNSALFHTNFAGVLAERGDVSGAEEHYRLALQSEAGYAEARLGIGRLRDDLGQLPQARDQYRAALRLEPNHAASHAALGKVLLELNQIPEAISSFHAALRIDPGNVPALSQLATHLRDKLPAAEQEALENLAAEPLRSDTERAALLFGLTQVCDGRGEFRKAAEHAGRANSMTLANRRQRGQGYNAAAHAVFVDRMIDSFTPEFFRRTRNFGVDSERPVFVFGLPRSGTTLLEQILASHSRVFGAGELRLARGDFEELGRSAEGPSESRSFAALDDLTAGTLRQLAERHLAELGAIDCTADRVTDKMPDNYLYIGLLASLFPRARFLHCRRDLRDVAVSCWLTHFREIPWANDPEHIGGRFREYLRIAEHWRRVLPHPVLEVEYAELVGDLPGAARRAVEWCGLDWEPRCLEFHRASRPVRTASVAQVRQPIYRRSLDRYRNYEAYLQPLLSRLPAACEMPSESYAERHIH